MGTWVFLLPKAEKHMNISRMSLKAFFSLTVVSLLAGVGPANAAIAMKAKSQEVVLQPGQSITLSIPCGTAPGCGTNGFALFDANVDLSIEVVQCGLVAGDFCSVDVTGFFGHQVAAGAGGTGCPGFVSSCQSFNFSFPFANLTGATKQVAFTGYATIINNPSNAQDQVTVAYSWTAVYQSLE
jgi:hypothetical protein